MPLMTTLTTISAQKSFGPSYIIPANSVIIFDGTYSAAISPTTTTTATISPTTTTGQVQLLLLLSRTTMTYYYDVLLPLLLPHTDHIGAT